jgi:hypothetical protein
MLGGPQSFSGHCKGFEPRCLKPWSLYVSHYTRRPMLIIAVNKGIVSGFTVAIDPDMHNGYPY